MALVKGKCMIDINILKELGLTGWPAVAAIAVICVSFVSWWIEKWPWEGIVDRSTKCECECHDED